MGELYAAFSYKVHHALYTFIQNSTMFSLDLILCNGIWRQAKA